MYQVPSQHPSPCHPASPVHGGRQGRPSVPFIHPPAEPTGYMTLRNPAVTCWLHGLIRGPAFHGLESGCVSAGPPVLSRHGGVTWQRSLPLLSGRPQSCGSANLPCHSSCCSFIELPDLGLEVLGACPWSSKEAEALTGGGLYSPPGFCLFLCQMSKWPFLDLKSGL